jgi:DNA-directed RNA polymerase subunit N (RpoN/RPB10)
MGKWNIRTCLQMAVYDTNSGGAHCRHAQSLDNLIDELSIIHVLCRKMILHHLFLLQSVNSAIHSTQKRFILRKKNATPPKTCHAACRIKNTHVTHKYLGHGHQKSSSSHT